MSELIRGSTMPQRHMNTIILMEFLEALPVGSTPTYKEMEALVGPGDRMHGWLFSARRALRNEKGIIYDAVRGVGLKRLSDVEIVQTADTIVSKLRRTCYNGRKRMDAVQEFDKLPQDLRLKHNATSSLLAAIQAVSKAKTVRQLETTISPQNGKISVGRIFEELKRISG